MSSAGHQANEGLIDDATSPALSAPHLPNEDTTDLCNTSPILTPLQAPHSHHSYDSVKHHLDTLPDAYFAEYVKGLPTNWTCENPLGQIITKRHLLHSIWGEYKDDAVILDFQTAILLNYRTPLHYLSQSSAPSSHIPSVKGGGCGEPALSTVLLATIYRTHYTTH